MKQSPSDVRVDGTLQSILDDIPTNVRVVGVGEANHGTRDFLDMRDEICGPLAEQGRIRMLLLEANAASVFALDDYVHGAKGDLRALVASLEFWMWDTEEFVSLVERLRARNATSSNPVSLVGIDVQSTTTAVKYIADHSRALLLSPSDVTLVEVLTEDGGTRATELTNEDRQGLVRVLERIAATDVSDGHRSVGLRAALAARVLLARLQMLDAPTVYDSAIRRDRAMADIASWITNSTNSGACLWSHNGHVAKATSFGLENMGIRLAETLGSSYYAIALLSREGPARMWDPKKELGVVPHELDAAPAFAIESVLLGEDASRDTAYLAISAAPAALKQWLETPRFLREIGSVYLDAIDAWRLMDMPQAWNAVVVRRRTEPTSPTPTGVRGPRK